jgi:hypothetical protein
VDHAPRTTHHAPRTTHHAPRASEEEEEEEEEEEWLIEPSSQGSCSFCVGTHTVPLDA